MKNIILTLLFLSLGTNFVIAGFAKYAGEFLYTGVGGRALGMGGAQVAVVNDVTAGYWNPAGLTDAAGWQVHFMHARQFINSVQYDYAAVSNQYGPDKTFAVSMVRLGVSGIKDSRAAGLYHDNELIGIDESRIKNFSVADYAFIFSYAQRYKSDYKIGVNAKVIYRDFYKESAMGIGFDAGIMYDWFDNLTLGLMFRDITTTLMAWSTSEKEFITPSLRPGISYKYHIDALDLYLQPAMDLGIMLESREEAAQLSTSVLSIDSNWGLEAGYANTVFLRLGYDDLQRFNGGLGLEMKKLGVDYSYTSFDQELGNVHRISFKLKIDTI